MDSAFRYFDAPGHIVLRGLLADDVDELSAVFDDPDQPRLGINVIGHR